MSDQSESRKRESPLAGCATGSTLWRVLSSVAEACLGVLLVVASWRLRARRRSGVTLSQTWSWLAIVFALVETATAAVLLAAWREQRIAAEPGALETYLSVGLWSALLIMIAWPVFLLVWTNREPVREEIASWSE